jgi:hypothetical protein
MNKLTITEKVFVPVSIDGILPDYIDDIYTLTQEFTNKGLVKEETNKYILSKEQLEKVISDAFEAGVIREYQERNYERRDYDAPIKEQYINLIL